MSKKLKAKKLFGSQKQPHIYLYVVHFFDIDQIVCSTFTILIQLKIHILLNIYYSGPKWIKYEYSVQLYL